MANSFSIIDANCTVVLAATDRPSYVASGLWSAWRSADAGVSNFWNFNTLAPRLVLQDPLDELNKTGHSLELINAMFGGESTFNIKQ